MIDISKLEQDRSALYQQYRTKQRYAIIGFIVAIVGIIIVSQFHLLIMIPIIIAGFVIGIVFSTSSYSYHTKFKQEIQPKVIDYVLEKYFDDYQYEPKSAIDQSRINATGMLQSPDRKHADNYLSGFYKGVKFEISNHKLEERYQTRDSKGNVQYHYRTYFSGRWLIYTFEKNFSDTIKIAERTPYSTRGLEKVETESIAFNKKFKIFSSSKEHLFYLITPLMLERLSILEEKNRGHMYYTFMKNELHIGINDSFNFLKLSFSKQINEKNIENFEEQIVLIAAIINEFRLDSNKYKNI